MIDFEKNKLIPVVVQDVNTSEVVMLAYMNEEAYIKTMKEKELYFYSRSREKIWKKGETSGNTQKLKSLYLDCDSDALLARVSQSGVACHTGNYSCFYTEMIKNEEIVSDVIIDVYKKIKDRKANPKEGSYTNYLFDKGIDKILKKIGEEASEVIIGAKNNKEELIYEISDLIYHLLVLMENQDVDIVDIKNELKKRYK